MRTIIIAAVAADGAIGRKGRLLAHIPEDLRRFRKLTTGHTVIMGRKTFCSLPSGALPNRHNIVVTRNPDFRAEGVTTVGSLETALDMARQSGETEAFIIGGGEIYRESFQFADELNLTLLDFHAPEADTFFPKIDPTTWTLANISDNFEANGATGDNVISYRFAVYNRKN